MTRKHDPLFYVGSIKAEKVTLGADDSTHLIKVRRAEVRDEINVGDGAGAVGRAVISDIGEAVTATITSRVISERPSPKVTFFYPIAKGSKNELVLQMLVELGVDEVVFFRARNSVPKWDDAKVGASLSRLETVAHEAAKQSRRAWHPKVAYVPKLQDLRGTLPARLVVADPEGGSIAEGPLGAEIGVFVGPEGGLAGEELAWLRSEGAALLSLGPTNLRTETAAPVAAALVLSACGRIP